MSGKRILAGERRPDSAYGTRMEERVCLCGAVQALGGGTLGRGVVVGSVGANPRFWHHWIGGLQLPATPTGAVVMCS